MPRFTQGQIAQSNPSEPNELETALARARAGNADARDVVVIANTKTFQAMPALEQQFKHSTDLDTKISIASGLVKLKDRDDTYWNFLLEQATLVVDSDMPDPFHDAQGNATNQLSPELHEWAKVHQIDFNTAGQAALYGLPGKVLQVGITGDPRGIPLLRRALLSHNPMIVIMAAKGLAQLQDKDSISLIIDACRMAGKGFDSAIAEAALIYFDDAQAQSAVDLYVPEDRAKIWRDAKVKGMKPFGYE